MARSNNSNNSYSPKRTTFKPYSPPPTPNLPKQQPYPYTPTVQSQPIQQRSFLGNIVDGFAFGTGSTIARNMFSSRPDPIVVETKNSEVIKIIDCTEFNQCLQFEKDGDKFLYNDCIKKLNDNVYSQCSEKKRYL